MKKLPLILCAVACFLAGCATQQTGNTVAQTGAAPDEPILVWSALPPEVVP